MKLRNKMVNDKGFTLVELMIVISIIAILAVVLVPKVGNIRSTVRDQGVVTNVSSVRAVLEMRVNDRDPSYTTERDELVNTVFPGEFTGGNELVNPFTNGKGIALWGSGNESSSSNALVVYAWNTTYAASNWETNNNYDVVQASRYGKVCVFVLQDAYIVFGYDGDGDAMNIPYYVVR